MSGVGDLDNAAFFLGGIPESAQCEPRKVEVQDNARGIFQCVQPRRRPA